MTSPRRLMMAAAGAAGVPYDANAVEFDGANDWIEKSTDLTSNADSKLFTLSLWFNRAVFTGTPFLLANTTVRIGIEFRGGNEIRVRGRNTSGSTILEVSTVTTFGASGWHHFLLSFDLANSSNRHLYIDDVDDAGTWSPYDDELIEFTRDDHAIGAGIGGGTKYDGDLADVWIDYGRFVNFSTVSNRRKFIDAAGKPVDLGSDGSIPFGAAPIMYFSGPTDTWHTNDGDGGGFTENGALTTASTSPSD